MARANITIEVNVDFQGVEFADLLLLKKKLETVVEGFEEFKQNDTEEYDLYLDKLTEVNEAITSRVRVDLQKRLRTAEARRAALATADEKRSRLDADIAALKEKLG